MKTRDSHPGSTGDPRGRPGAATSRPPLPRPRRGFSLVELLVVLAIVAVLAVVAIPAYQDYVGKTEVSEALVLTGGLKSEVDDLWWQKGTYVGITNGMDGIPEAASISGRYVRAVIVKDGSLTAVFRDQGVSPGLAGATLTLSPSPTTYSGSIRWTCTSDAPAAYLPLTCGP